MSSANTMVQLDFADIVSDFEARLGRAEHMLSFSRQIRRLGKVLSATGREIVDEYPEDFRTVGLDPVDIGSQVKTLGEQVLSATEVDYDDIERQATMLRALINLTEKEKGRARVELRMRALALLGRWKKLTEAKELEAKANHDLPYPVKAIKGSNEAVTGERSGVTYWHNLRAVWTRENGRLSQQDNEAWLEGKRRLTEGEDDVTVGDWTFQRLV